MSAPVAPQNPHPATPPAHPRGRYLARLSLLALGVVYGDIGTSPLYALQQAFHGQHGIPVTPGNVLGVLSLIVWSLILIVTVKYHVVIIRADNKGEGGVLALMALVNGSRLMRGLAPRRLMIVLAFSEPRCCMPTARSLPQFRCYRQSRVLRLPRRPCS